MSAASDLLTAVVEKLDREILSALPADAPPSKIILLGGDDPPPPPSEPPAGDPPPPPAPPEGGDAPRPEPAPDPIDYNARTILLDCRVKSETRLIRGTRLAESATVVVDGQSITLPAGTVLEAETFAPIGASIPMKIAFAEVKTIAAIIIHFEASNEKAIAAAKEEARRNGILGADGMPARANGHRVIPPHGGRR